MKRFSIFVCFTLLLLSPCIAKNYKGLKVLGDFNKLTFLVQSLKPNILGITNDDLEKCLKVGLLRNRIKPEPFGKEKGTPAPHYVYLSVYTLNIDDTLLAVADIKLHKYTYRYMEKGNELAFHYAPDQGNYGSFGTFYSKKIFLENLSQYIDTFCLDYLESNL